ncbi:RNA polymerase sigma-70 factor [Pedobacter sp.]|jgi:RNA polymerase sigma-70 factor (ECF subfamily)|uniref:RNA polymerase sigma factor n=1 Tax=Pedobacter sp. TaxID=1411316 RepID=UPI002CB147DE|nr:RNA polymerase sigma-70 factor [Pedobacter sp.]HWW37871.1 RNA polymerase sigma-70 factor [Pedobacter sp.]
MNAYRPLSDTELAAKLSQQDKAALEEIYLRHWAGLYDYARKLIRDQQAAEDLVQDLFASLLANMDRITITSSLQSYLYNAIRNRVIKAYYKDQNRAKYVASLKDFIDTGQCATDELVLEREMRQRIEAAIATFPPKMREVYEMSRTENITRKEIAKATHVSENTVKTQMTRALKILRSKLTALF